MKNPYFDQFRTLEHNIGYWGVRDKLVKKFSWAIPNPEAIQTLRAYKHGWVEIGAGTGYWASLAGNVLPFDKDHPILSRNDYGHNVIHTTVFEGTEQILPRISPQMGLLLCWPPMDPMAVNALRLYRGNKLAYVGEDFEGCTANDEFFQELEKHWTEITRIGIPQWDGIHDDLTLYRRKKCLK